MSNRIVYTPKRGIQPSGAQKVGGRLLFVLITLFFIFAGGIYAIRNPAWRIARVQIEGARRVDARNLERDVFNMLAGSYFSLVPKNFYAFVDGQRIKEELRRIYPEIFDVQIKRVGFDALHMRVEERGIWGILCNDLRESEWIHGADTVAEEADSPDIPLQEKNTACVYVDSSGFAFETAPNPIGSLIVRVRNDNKTVPVSARVIESDSMDFMLLLAREIPRAIQEDAIGFEMLSRVPSEIRVMTSGRYELWMARDRDVGEALGALDTLLKQEIQEKKNNLEYADLRFGSKVFYKFKSQ